MGKLKPLKTLLIGLISLGGCQSAGTVKIYSLDVDKKVLRNEQRAIPFSDPRMKCNDLEGGRECRYLCMDSDDVNVLLNSIEIK